jgi:polyhydroxyalkanoate synthesis regulator phasin
MLEEVRKYMEAALDKLTPAKAQEAARSLMQGEGREQVAKKAQDLLEWSQKNRDRLTQTIQREVKSQLKALGLATKEELDALKRRVRELERGPGVQAASKKTAARKAPARKAPARKASTGRASA